MSVPTARSTWNPQRLFTARDEMGISQEELARRITKIMGREAQPVRARNIVRWEKPRDLPGAHAPHVDFIVPIAEALDTDPMYFFGSDDADEEDRLPRRGQSLSGDLHRLAQLAGILERRPDLLDDVLAADAEEARS
jgi:transcriptional regulator with XRE-family HTH domain